MSSEGEPRGVWKWARMRSEIRRLRALMACLFSCRRPTLSTWMLSTAADPDNSEHSFLKVPAPTGGLLGLTGLAGLWGESLILVPNEPGCYDVAVVTVTPVSAGVVSSQ